MDLKTSTVSLFLFIVALIIPRAVSAQQTPPIGAPIYGNVGDPYATEGGKPSCKKHLDSCGKKLSPGGDYCLAKDVAAAPDASGKCFVFREGVRLDLGGHTVHGRIYANGDLQGTHIFNGSVLCDFPDDASNAGCITLLDSRLSRLTKTSELHHLTVHNSATNHVSRGIFVDWSAVEQVPRFGLRIYNTTIYTPSCTIEPNTICTRVNNVRVQTNHVVTLEAFQNDWICSSDTNACQGIELFNVNNAHIHHNKITMSANKLPETGRAIDCDGNFVPGSDHCEVDSNYIIANNNRAFRVRSSTNADFHDNYIANCTNTSAGCLYLYDQRSFPEDYGDMIIEHNTFEMNGGQGIFLRCGRGAIIRDNIVKSAGENKVSGLFALVSSWGKDCATDVTILRNGIAGKPNIKVMSNLPASAAATVCASGVVEGTGKITEVQDCP